MTTQTKERGPLHNPGVDATEFWDKFSEPETYSGFNPIKRLGTRKKNKFLKQFENEEVQGTYEDAFNELWKMDVQPNLTEEGVDISEVIQKNGKYHISTPIRTGRKILLGAMGAGLTYSISAIGYAIIQDPSILNSIHLAGISGALIGSAMENILNVSEINEKMPESFKVYKNVGSGNMGKFLNRVEQISDELYGNKTIGDNNAVHERKDGGKMKNYFSWIDKEKTIGEKENHFSRLIEEKNFDSYSIVQ